MQRTQLFDRNPQSFYGHKRLEPVLTGRPLICHGSRWQSNGITSIIGNDFGSFFTSFRLPMILDRELEVSADGQQVDRSVIYRLSESISRHGILLFGCFLIAVVVLQVLSGAYKAEFSGYPDEPAHYVTSLMLRNYIAEFKFSSPLHFAQDYYYHYPKVALGHWPPVFYIVQAFWMLLFSASRTSIRLEVAVTTALLAWSVFRECRQWLGTNAGILAGALLISLPLIQTYTNEEMAEGLLVLFCFWACIHFTRYLESGRWINNFYFGVLFSLAVLTKGNGWLLALIPPTAIVLTRRYSLLTRRSFWVAPLTVSILCLPWQIVTMKLAAQGWEGGSEPSLHYTLAALGQFALVLPQILGFSLLALLALGVFQLVLRPLVARRAVARRAPTSRRAACAAPRCSTPSPRRRSTSTTPSSKSATLKRAPRAPFRPRQTTCKTCCWRNRLALLHVAHLY